MPDIAPTKAPLVCALIYDGLCTFEFGITTELFALPRPEFDPWYRFATVAAEPGALRAMGGISVTAQAGLSLLQVADLILVPGWRGPDAPVPAPLIAALRAAATRGARIASICSGVFVLAAAGLLEGRRATTHWRYAEILAQRYPGIRVDPDVLFVAEGPVMSSAGSAAGLDLGLHLIRQDYGARIAASVARRLVLPAQRDGGQRQFVPRPTPRPRPGPGLARLQDQIRAALDEDWPIARMARAGATSSRTLARRFHDETGMTPLTWLRQERITRAAELLEDSTLPLADIAASCGFGSPETLRRDFRRLMGVAPQPYRDRMGSPHP